LNNALKDLLATHIERMIVRENSIFLKNIDKYYDDLPSDFKVHFSIYFDNNLDQYSPLGQELNKELKDIIRKKDNKIEEADFEIINDQ
jgi:hypothetical protein